MQASEALAQVFSGKFCEISKKTFFHRTPPVAASAIFVISYLKVTSHGICHYLWSANLLKSFSVLIVSIFILCQFFFNRICPVEKYGVTPTMLISCFINFKIDMLFLIFHGKLIFKARSHIKLSTFFVFIQISSVAWPNDTCPLYRMFCASFQNDPLQRKQKIPHLSSAKSCRL